MYKKFPKLLVIKKYTAAYKTKNFKSAEWFICLRYTGCETFYVSFTIKTKRYNISDHKNSTRNLISYKRNKTIFGGYCPIF